MTGDFPCPCCGYLVFDEPPGSYAICPVCQWEDDALQLEYATTLSGGANGGTLLDEQRGFLAREGLHPTGIDLPRDPLWRPIDPRRTSSRTSTIRAASARRATTTARSTTGAHRSGGGARRRNRGAGVHGGSS